MRASDPPVSYLVGTPKGRLTRPEKQLVYKPWRKAGDSVEIRFLKQGDDLYVLAQSADRLTALRAPVREACKIASNNDPAVRLVQRLCNALF
jgi:hypothetical protein